MGWGSTEHQHTHGAAVDVSISVLGHPTVPRESTLGLLSSTPRNFSHRLPFSPSASLNTSPRRSHPAPRRFIPEELMIQTTKELFQTPWASP